jgi:hypothetical protein
MFGLFNIDKILVLAIILVIVWQGFKLVGRLDLARRGARRDAGPTPGRPRAAGGAVQPIEDMVKCPSCGDYVPKGHATACQRASCPY